MRTLRLYVAVPWEVNRLIVTAAVVFAVACSVPANEYSGLADTKLPNRSAPTELRGIPTGGVIRWPWVASHGDTILVAANVFERETLSVRPAVISRLIETANGNLMPIAALALPPGDFQFAYPRIFVAGDRVHLLWSEFGSPVKTVTQWNLNPIQTTLWHSVLERGSWSIPDRVTSSEWIGWGEEAGDGVVDTQGVLHIALWSAATGTVHHFRLDPDGWHESRLLFGGLTRASAIGVHGDTVVLAGLDEVPGPARVMVAMSVDRGDHWTRNLAVSTRLRERGMVSRLVLVAGDETHLIIGEKPLNSFYLDTIRVVRVNPAATLSSTRIVTPAADADQFVVARSSCNSLVILTRGFSRKPQVQRVIVPANGGRVTVEPLLGDTTLSMFPGLGRGRRSMVAVFASAEGSPPRLRNAAMPLRCD